jgi:hypothetical protein
LGRFGRKKIYGPNLKQAVAPREIKAICVTSGGEVKEGEIEKAASQVA